MRKRVFVALMVVVMGVGCSSQERGWSDRDILEVTQYCTALTGWSWSDCRKGVTVDAETFGCTPEEMLSVLDVMVHSNGAGTGDAFKTYCGYGEG